MRDYNDIVRRVEALQGDRVHCRVLAEIQGYPVFNITLGDPGRPTVFLTGGIHGDEPAGVEAVLAVLERDLDGWLEKLCFEVVPCLNPYGYVHNTRHNSQDVDLNWAYERDDVEEIQIFRDLVEGRRFECALDFHEDWESPGYYLYELCRGTAAVGPEITRRVAQVCLLNTRSVIEGQRAENGLVFPDIEKEMKLRGEGLPPALYYENTDHMLASESPTNLDLETRVQTHLITLEIAIQAHLPT